MRFWIFVAATPLAACSPSSETDDGEKPDTAHQTQPALSPAKPNSDGTKATLTDAHGALANRKVNCATVAKSTAPAGQPADDIIGVRKAMTPEAVYDVLKCADSAFAIKTEDDDMNLEEGGTVSQIELTADSGLERVKALFVGLPGEERLVHVDRIVEFPEGEQLPIAGIKAELTKKYGEFDESDKRGALGAIVRSRDGQKMSRTNSNYGRCQSNDVNYVEQLPCSMVVAYQIQSDRKDPKLASRFAVAITDHAQMWDMVERGLAARDAFREEAAEKVQDVITF